VLGQKACQQTANLAVVLHDKAMWRPFHAIIRNIQNIGRNVIMVTEYFEPRAEHEMLHAAGSADFKQKHRTPRFVA
jgi:methylase of polypeptide subunit release factors